ncbi:uncharacterized protein [Diadema antillarum]|uniref:uncharacterized protein n=1 Tax=Diadema antillarum TaxID=105358 RepID=UPI003A8C370A
MTALKFVNNTDYDKKVNSLLSDNSTYERLKRDPSAAFKKRALECLQQLEKGGHIDKPLYYSLYPGDDIPAFYGLPKIHKTDTPLRPIVSSINSVTYNIAKQLTSILSPLVGLSDHHIQNSGDFIEKVRDIKVEENETIASFDVSALFTSVPPDKAIEVVRERLSSDTSLHQRTKLSPEQICQLLELCLSTTYFVYNGAFFKQKHGCAMGSPISPVLANLYMEHFETSALDSFNGTGPSHWYRYVDDTWVKIQSTELDSFFQHINNCDPFIKFTVENIRDNSLPFLDCLITVNKDGTLCSSVYRKPTHTDQYLLFDSHHPLVHKLGVVRTLFHRASYLPSSEETKEKEHQHLRTVLKNCGYKHWSIEKALHPRKRDVRDRASSSTTQQRGRGVSVPYCQGLSEKIQRIFSFYRIPVYFKPTNTLRQRLVHPKDKIPKHKRNNVIYRIKCQGKDCKENYIGETKQPLHKRLYQHRRSSSAGNESAVFTHLKNTGHPFEDKEVDIIDKETRCLNLEELLSQKRIDALLEMVVLCYTAFFYAVGDALVKIPWEEGVIVYYVMDTAIVACTWLQPLAYLISNREAKGIVVSCFRCVYTGTR